MSKGINEPYGDIYWWFLYNIPFFAGLKESYKWLALTSVCYSFLTGDTTSKLASLKMNWSLQGKTFDLGFLNVKINVKRILCSTILLFIVINSFIALSGDFGGFFKPVSIPNDYYAVANILNNDNEEGLVLVLPLDAISLKPVWAPIDIPYMQDPFATSIVRPVVTVRLTDQSQYYLIKFINNMIYYNRTRNLGSILSYFNIKFIVVHKDLNIGRYPYLEDLSYAIFWVDPDRILNFLRQQQDLIQIYNGNELALFKVKGKSNKMIASQIPVIGSLDFVCKLTEYPLNSSPSVFIVDWKNINLVENAQKIIFYNKNTTDVLLGLVPGEYLIYAYKFAKVSQSKDKHWVVSQFLPVRSEVAKVGDLPFSQLFAFTSGKGTILRIPFAIKRDDSYEIWGRLWFGKEAGTVKITFNGRQMILNTFSPVPGFRWVRLFGPLPLLKGEYQLRIENVKGRNAIDSLAVIPASTLEELQNKCSKLLNGKIVTYMSSDSWIETMPSSTLLTYEEINPTRYIIHVNTSEPFYLIFDESYSNSWVAYIGEQQIPVHFIANGFANGWYINKTGTYTITLEFRPQKLFYIGSVISIITFVICFLMAFLENVSRRRHTNKGTKVL
jgi:hypothetical protein